MNLRNRWRAWRMRHNSELIAQAKNEVMMHAALRMASLEKRLDALEAEVASLMRHEVSA